MKRKRRFAAVVALAVGFSVSLVRAQEPTSREEKDPSKEVERVQAAAKVLDEVMAAPDKGVPEEVLESAKCIGVVPSMLKAGFVVGGSYGKGVATCRSASSWSAPAPFTVAGGSWGLQIGGEAVDLVMLVMNDKGMQSLLSSKFKLGADASVAAGPVGRQAEGETDWKMRSEVLTYSRARGVFAGLTLDGAVIKQDEDETRILYSRMVPFKDILTGTVSAPKGTEPFVATVQKYTTQAKAEERSATAPPKQ